VADTPAGALMPVLFNDDAIAEDFAHLPPTARNALDIFRREVDRDGGLPTSRLKRCEGEGRDGSRLAGCLKTYVPWPTGRFGLVLLPTEHPTRPLAVRAFAYGVRHPTGNKPSVYTIAHERRQPKDS
jgi:hypothetical protein